MQASWIANPHGTGTPDRRAKGTPLSGCDGLVQVANRRDPRATWSVLASDAVARAAPRTRGPYSMPIPTLDHDGERLRGHPSRWISSRPPDPSRSTAAGYLPTAPTPRPGRSPGEVPLLVSQSRARTLGQLGEGIPRWLKMNLRMPKKKAWRLRASVSAASMPGQDCVSVACAPGTRSPPGETRTTHIGGVFSNRFSRVEARERCESQPVSE
jgi:hypothetical protein